MERPYAIGIAGGSCSGKTTLSARLQKALQAKGKTVAVLNMDHYYKDPTPTTIAPITRREYPEHNHPDSLHLDRLIDDFQKALRGLPQPVDYVIVEGLFALRQDELRAHYDLKIFVDLKSDERLARRIPRFMELRKASYQDVVERFLDTVRFRHDELVEPTRWHADLVLNGTLDTGKGIDVVLACIDARL